MQPVGERSDAGLRIYSACSAEASEACVCSRLVTESHPGNLAAVVACCQELFGWQHCAIPGPKHELPASPTDFARDTHLLNSYKSFGERLSFGLDGNPLTGNEELDHWIKAGRRFKQEAYGYQYSVYEQ